MTVLQAGFIANSPEEPGCSKDISSAKPVPVSDAVQLSKIFQGGWGFSVAATADDKLYIWGVNAATMLAKGGSADDGANPTQLDLIAEGVQAAAGGFDHCAVVQQGKLSIFGPQYRPADGSLLLSLDIPSPVTAVSAGEHHTLILTATGDVYALGSNREGQLGVPSASTESNQPVLALGPATGSEQVVAIAAGARHSVAVTATGKVYAWGFSLHGQCGTGVVVPTVPAPALVEALGPLKCVGVAAGMSHTLLLADTGDIYALGSNAEGQLGDGTTTSSLVPKLVEALGVAEDPVVKIAAGGRHSVALTQSGIAYAWGFGAFGQLAIGEFVDKVTTPQKVAVPEGTKIADVAAGWWHTAISTAG